VYRFLVLCIITFIIFEVWTNEHDDNDDDDDDNDGATTDNPTSSELSAEIRR